MESMAFAGALLRMLRLERNWSQETLCENICAVSYLSKIEQGRVQPNETLLRDLFAKMDIAWQSVPREEGDRLCEQLYDLVFSDDISAIELSKEEGHLRQEGFSLGERYLDYLILRAYCCGDKDLIPEQLRPLLDSRQMCLLYLLEGETEKAMQANPCALTIEKAGISAYSNGDNTLALELLQRSYDLACQHGYARIMMCCQAYMGNTYSDLRNVVHMLSHYQIAARLARSLGETELLQTMDYNIASTRIECGEYEAGYAYFSRLEHPSALDLHKLAVCCEKLGKDQEALQALNTAQESAEGVVASMCALVRFRVENTEYLKDAAYGKLLLETFETLKKSMPAGYARFHLPWVEEWCTANRKYRMAYEITRGFL